jgi:hypothetical protein
MAKKPQNPWTPEEDDFIKENIDTPWTIVAGQLGRTVFSVRSRCARIRAVKATASRLMGHSDVELKRLHSFGMSNKEIAAKLDVTGECIRKGLRRLGLQSNERDFSSANGIRAVTMKSVYGVENVTQLNAKKQDELAKSLGWPSIGVACIEILEILYTNPLMTALQLNAIRGTGTAAYSHLKRLQRHGLVIQSPRLSVDGYKATCVYSLSTSAIEMKQKFLRNRNATQ